MIENISIWAKNITIAVIIVSIFEMLLPNQKMKQYIKVIMGLYILFNILSPLIGQDISIDIEGIINDSKSEIATTEPVDQTSMDKRLKQIGEEEFEKDIVRRIENEGFIVNNCIVELEMKEETKIKKIVVEVERGKENIQEENIENKLVDEIKKIKEVNINKNEKKEEKNSNNLTTEDIKQIKKLLIQEYEVNEKCLKIN